MLGKDCIFKIVTTTGTHGPADGSGGLGLEE